MWGFGSERDRKSTLTATLGYVTPSHSVCTHSLYHGIKFSQAMALQQWLARRNGVCLLLVAIHRNHLKKETTFGVVVMGNLCGSFLRAIPVATLCLYNDHPPVLCGALAIGCSQPEWAHCHPETSSERCPRPQHWSHPLLLGEGMSSNCLKLSGLSGAPSPDLCKEGELVRTSGEWHSPGGPGEWEVNEY